MLNYGKHFIDREDIKNVIRVLNSKNLTQGKEVHNFEKQLSIKFGAKEVAVLSSGTAALHLSGLALGWKKNDLIITTPITFASTANSIIFSGSKVDFVDINKDDYNLNLNYLEDKIKK